MLLAVSATTGTQLSTAINIRRQGQHPAPAGRNLLDWPSDRLHRHRRNVATIGPTHGERPLTQRIAKNSRVVYNTGVPALTTILAWGSASVLVTRAVIPTTTTAATAMRATAVILN